MATSSEGGAEATAYGVGGAGGKFRKKISRREQRLMTPYDRPLTAQRAISNLNNVNNDNNGLFTKLVLTPASKLISYGANRFFASVFRKRLPPPQAPEVNDDAHDELEVVVPTSNQSGKLKITGGHNSQALHSSTGDGISELELLLKQKTFSRSEIDHLTGLLQSRAAVELSSGADTNQIFEETESEFARHKSFLESPLEENRKGKDISHGFMPMPKSNSIVIENGIASPAELAKSYMSTGPKISSMNNQFGRENTGFLGDALFTSKSPYISLTMKRPVNQAALENGCVTPKSRGRSAIYSMARSHSSIHPFAVGKRIGLTSNSYAGPSTSSSNRAPMEHNANLVSKPMAMKRRSSVLDDDIGSVSPIRRIRQRPLGARSLVPARVMDNDSPVEPKTTISNLSETNENDSIARAHVPSKSSEMAARILQHLEKMTPKEKSSKSKLVSVREKSPFRLTQSMLRGQALKSMEDVDSSKLQLGVQSDHKLEDIYASTLPVSRNSTFEKVEKNVPKESAGIPGMLNSVMENGSLKKAHVPDEGTSDSALQNVVATFRMSAQEDDDEICYGLPPKALTTGKQSEQTLVGNNASLHEESESVKTSVQPEESEIVKANVQPNVMIPIGRSNENPFKLMVGAESGNIAFPSKKSVSALQSKVLHPTISPSNLNGRKDSLSLISSTSEIVDNDPPLPPESSIGNPESKSENAFSLVGIVSTADGSQMKIPESEQGGSLMSGGTNGKSHMLSSAALNGTQFFRPPVVSVTTAPFDANQSLTTSSSQLTSTNNISSFGAISSSSANTSSSVSMSSSCLTNTITSSASSGNPFGSTVASSVFGGPVLKFDASTTTSTAQATSAEFMNLKTKSEKEPNFGGNSNGSFSTSESFTAAKSGSSHFGLGASVSYSTANMSSQFGGSHKSLGSGVGTGLFSSNQIDSSPSLPSVNVSSNASLGISLSNSQFNPSSSLGFSSSTSLSKTSEINHAIGTTITSKFGTSSAVSDGSTVSSSTGAAPGIVSFGLGSSSSTSSSITLPVFNFTGSSTVTPITTSANALSSVSSNLFTSGTSTSVSSAVTSNAVSNVFGFASPSAQTGFSFGAASTTTFAPTNASSMAFNSTTSSSNPFFSFSAASSSGLLSSSMNKPIFGNTPFSFEASPGNGDQINAEDNMAEDPVQSSTAIPMFGQPAVSSPVVPMFGSTFPSQANPFQFTGQQNQITPVNPPPFQASGSLEFSAGGSFSLGSAGTDKSSRKFVKVSRNKNRKK